MLDRRTKLAAILAVAWMGYAGLANEPRIEDVLAAHPVRPDVACAVTVAVSLGDQALARVERFTPPDRWELLSDHGQPPSAEALQDYALGIPMRDSAHLPSEPWREFIDSETSSIASEDADTVTFAFQPAEEALGEPADSDEEREVAGKLRGSLRVRKADLLPLRLAIENTARFVMMPTVEAYEVRRLLTFAEDPAAGVVVRSMEAAGRFRMQITDEMVEIDLRVDYSDYDCQTAPAEG